MRTQQQKWTRLEQTLGKHGQLLQTGIFLDECIDDAG